MQKINPSQLSDFQKDRVIIDVRSPSEYAKGHIPNAVNIPLFSDEERAKVGTAYKKVSPEKAMIKGLEFVGPKMAMFVKRATKLAPNRKLLVYCWRGGKRSGSLSWLYEMAGFDVAIVVGGYKAYRNFVLESFDNQILSLNRVGGRTGTGKTEILQELELLGEQIIDLEGLAHHKGSAFGALGELPQPSVEQFENKLHAAISLLNKNKRVWVENESRGVGKCFIPQGFWDQFCESPLYNVQIPLDLRILRLVEDYAQYPKEELIQVFKNIERKLGGQHAQKAITALENDDYATAVEVALVYYDKTYQFGLENNLSKNAILLEFDHADMKKIAKKLSSLVHIIIGLK
jgi:tRNA 2-selenouridine synthase